MEKYDLLLEQIHIDANDGWFKYEIHLKWAIVFVTAFVTALVTTINCLIVATSIAVYTCVYSYPDLIIFKPGCTRGIYITFWVTLGGVRVLFVSSTRAPTEVVGWRE